MYSLCFGLPVQHVINEYMPKNMEHQEHHINILHMGHVAILVLLKSITISLVLFTFRSRWFFSENTIKSSTTNKTTNHCRAVRVFGKWHDWTRSCVEDLRCTKCTEMPFFSSFSFLIFLKLIFRITFVHNPS